MVTRRPRTSNRRRTPESQATGAFNQLVATRPVWAALILAVVALAAWLYLRNTGGGSDGAAASSTATATHSTGASTQAPKPTQKSGAKPKPTTKPAPGTDAASGLPYIAESQLPTKAQEVLAAIRAGGPFEFEEDGGHFGNYEGVLPKKKSSYYSEYTVQMPGDSTRGAHRFVVGDGGEIYWTDDHYESFSVVKEGA